MDCKYSGSSKQRRDLLKAETELLGDEIPFEYGKLSQLRILKAACAFLKKEKHFNQLKNVSLLMQTDRFVGLHETIKNDGMLGFIVCFSKIGELIYLSESITDYLGFNSMDLLLNYDYIYELAHSCDKHMYTNLAHKTSEYTSEKFSFFSLLFASKVKRKQTSLSEYKLFKLTGHFDSITETYIANCVPVLSVSNRELLTAYNAECFTSMHYLDLKFIQLDEAAESLLGYSFLTDDMFNKSLYELLCPESLITVAERHRQILATKNSKGYLDPIRLLHNSGFYISCLLNMYLDSNGYLTCKYQLMSQNDVTQYTDYVLNFKRDWFVSISFNTNSNSDYDADEDVESEDHLNASEDLFQDSFSSSYNQINQKRNFDDNNNYEYENNHECSIEKNSVKKIKTEYVEPEPLSEMIMTTREPSRQALSRLTSADVKINHIKEALVKDCETMRVKEFETDLDLGLDEELLGLLQTEKEIKIEGYTYFYPYSSDYFHNQNNISFYDTCYITNNKCFVQQKMQDCEQFYPMKNHQDMSLNGSFEDEDVENYCGQFELSETDWLESFDEIF